MPTTEKGNKRERLMRRLSKLFALGDGSRNPDAPEVLAAISKAKSLMAEHNIAIAEIDGYNDTNKAKSIRILIREDIPYTRKGKFARYDHPIMSATAAITQTEVMIRTKFSETGKYEQVVFVGDETDVAVALHLYMILLSSLRKYTRTFCGSGWSKFHTDYALGFGMKVLKRAREQTQDNTTDSTARGVALMLVSKKEALARYMDGLIMNKSKKSRRRSVSSYYYDGYRDGDKMNLNTFGLKGKS